MTLKVIYYIYGEDGCDYKAKNLGHVMRHKGNIHDVDVTYYLCGENGCEYKAEQRGSHRRLLIIKHLNYYIFE